MRILILIICVFAGSLSAQNSFRIFDAQMNDVTNGVLFLADTNSAMIQVNLSVENIDSVAHVVTAGRLVISQPAGAENAFSWNLINYLPTIDSSMVPASMPPSASEPFEAYYFPNSSPGLATINYCFWETTYQSNYSCVTVTYENQTPAGMQYPAPSHISFGPNPASNMIGFGWSHSDVAEIRIYSAQGVLVHTIQTETNTAEIDLTLWQEGLYFYQFTNDNEVLFNGTFLHVQSE